MPRLNPLLCAALSTSFGLTLAPPARADIRYQLTDLGPGVVGRAVNDAGQALRRRGSERQDRPMRGGASVTQLPPLRRGVRDAATLAFEPCAPGANGLPAPPHALFTPLRHPAGAVK